MTAAEKIAQCHSRVESFRTSGMIVMKLSEFEQLLDVAEAWSIYDGLCAAYDNGLCSREMVEDAMRKGQAALARLRKTAAETIAKWRELVQPGPSTTPGLVDRGVMIRLLDVAEAAEESRRLFEEHEIAAQALVDALARLGEGP